MLRTLVGIVVLVLGALALEFLSLSSSGFPTISVTVQYLGLHWNPFVIYTLSVLLGHFFLKPENNAAQYIGEWGEVFIVVWVGWGIFWYFYASPQLLPLSTLERTLLIAFSIAIGAFVWTIEFNVAQIM